MNDALKSITSATLRAMAGLAEVDVIFSPRDMFRKDQTLGPSPDQPSQSNIRLPLPDSSLSESSVDVMRGAADSHALWLRHHSTHTHQKMRPNSVVAAAYFHSMERARVEALGALQMDGVAHNLLQLASMRESSTDSQDSSAQTTAFGAQIFNMLLGHAPRNDVSEVNAQAQKISQNRLWQEKLRGSLTDQAAFSRHSLDLLLELGLVEPHTPSNDPQDDHSDQKNTDTQAEENETQSSQTASEEDAQDAQNWDDTPLAALDESLHGQEEQNDEPAPQQNLNTQDASDAPKRNDRDADSPHGSAGLYQIYTSHFDEEIAAHELADPLELNRLRALLDKQLGAHTGLITKLANRLQRRLMARQQRHWQFDLEEGVLDTSRLARVIANPALPLTYKQERETDFRDTLVCLLIDNSGSMRGRPIALAAMSADIISRTLERCGVASEILGFTTRAWKGGKSRELWVNNGQPAKPGRLNDIRHIVYKSAQNPIRRSRKNMGLMLKEGLLKENIDGEALVWAYNRIIKRPEARKVLMVISDGAPVDDSTLSVNPVNYLENDLRNVISWIERKTHIELRAIGIGHDVTRYYRDSMILRDVEDLGPALIGQLDTLFAK
jgi:cobaltochelatase CobT